MLKLRLEQLTYRIREEADFIDWYVNEFMPDQLPEYHTLFDVDTLKEMTKNGRDQAIKYGFNQPMSHSHFITLMWHIGADFYQQPGFKAIAESNEPEAERIDAFYQLSDDLWDEAGEQADERELEQLEGFYKELSADAALTAASMAPPPAGTAADVVSLGRSLWKGDWGGALLDAVGIIPIVGDGIKGVTKGTKIAAKMKEVSAAIKTAKIKLAKMKKNAAAKKAKATKDATKNKTKNNSVQACKKCDKEAGGGIIGGKKFGARLGERRISKEQYDALRSSTPNSAIRDKINKGKIPPFPDESLPGMTVNKKLEADHIVSMDKITRMEGFDKLSNTQQLSILNNPDNFIGLSKSANTSKGSKSFKEWTEHKKTGTQVDQAFKAKMIKIENKLEIDLQQQIDQLINLNNSK